MIKQLILILGIPLLALIGLTFFTHPNVKGQGTIPEDKTWNAVDLDECVVVNKQPYIEICLGDSLTNAIMKLEMPFNYTIGDTKYEREFFRVDLVPAEPRNQTSVFSIPFDGTQALMGGEHRIGVKVNTPDLGDFRGTSFLGAFHYPNDTDGCQRGTIRDYETNNDIKLRFCQDGADTLWGTLTISQPVRYESEITWRADATFSQGEYVTPVEFSIVINNTQPPKLTLDPMVATIRKVWHPGINYYTLAGLTGWYWHIENSGILPDYGPCQDLSDTEDLGQYCIIGTRADQTGFFFPPEWTTISRVAQDHDTGVIEIQLNCYEGLGKSYHGQPWKVDQLNLDVRVGGDCPNYADQHFEIQLDLTTVAAPTPTPTLTPTLEPTATPESTERKNETHLPIIRH